MTMSFNVETKTFASSTPVLVVDHTLQDIVFKVNQLASELAKIQDQLTKGREAVQLAKDADVYHDDDILPPASSTAGLIVF